MCLGVYGLLQSFQWCSSVGCNTQEFLQWHSSMGQFQLSFFSGVQCPLQVIAGSPCGVPVCTGSTSGSPVAFQCTLDQPVTLAQGKGCVHHLDRRNPTLGGTCIYREWSHIVSCDKIAKWGTPDWSMWIYRHWWILSSMRCCWSLKRKLFLVIEYQYYSGLMQQSTFII